MSPILLVLFCDKVSLPAIFSNREKPALCVRGVRLFTYKTLTCKCECSPYNTLHLVSTLMPIVTFETTNSEDTGKNHKVGSVFKVTRTIKILLVDRLRDL